MHTSINITVSTIRKNQNKINFFKTTYYTSFSFPFQLENECAWPIHNIDCYMHIFLDKTDIHAVMDRVHMFL